MKTKTFLPPEAKRSRFGPGPWVDEPDRADFRLHGLPCLALRNRRVGVWCGYVAVPPGHPLHGRDTEEAHEALSLADAVPHGGVTYASGCDSAEEWGPRIREMLEEHGGDFAAQDPEELIICHRPEPGESDDVWWLGFDLNHSGDLVPIYRHLEGDTVYDHAAAKDAAAESSTPWRVSVYGDLAYVWQQCEKLAAGLSEMS